MLTILTVITVEERALVGVAQIHQSAVNMKMMMSAIPGVPGLDYPTLSTDDLLFIAAKTQFNCQRKEFGGIFYLHLRVLIKVTKYLSSSVPDCSQSPFWG